MLYMKWLGTTNVSEDEIQSWALMSKRVFHVLHLSDCVASSRIFFLISEICIESESSNYMCTPPPLERFPEATIKVYTWICLGFRIAPPWVFFLEPLGVYTVHFFWSHYKSLCLEFYWNGGPRAPRPPPLDPSLNTSPNIYDYGWGTLFFVLRIITVCYHCITFPWEHTWDMHPIPQNSIFYLVYR